MEEVVADAGYAASIEQKKGILSQGMAQIEALLRAHPADADLEFCMAYLWYWWPERTADRRDKVYSRLAEALRIDPNHVGSRLYLGFHQFDDRRYQDALATLRSIDLSAVGNHAQSVSRLKIEELVLCCKLRMDWTTIGMEEAEGLRRHYAAFREVVVPPAPAEIARTAVELCHRVPEEEFDVLVREVVAIIEIAEGEGGGSLASELRQLRVRLLGQRPAPKSA